MERLNMVLADEPFQVRIEALGAVLLKTTMAHKQLDVHEATILIAQAFLAGIQKTV